MLKQDVLEIVHSKVREYTTHQLKKVNFRQNPDVCRNEDLKTAVNELRYVQDYTETRRPQSEVFGENYGEAYPTFTITDMKEYKFWPFVAGNEWDDCTSLRVTPGSLLFSLLETFEELEKNGKVLRFATDRFEGVSIKTAGRRCLKNTQSGSECRDSGDFSSATYSSKDGGRKGPQMTKISFIYFGLSLSHLRNILQEAGLSDVTTEDIAMQNRKILFGKSPPPLPRPVSLTKLVSDKKLPVVVSSIQLERHLEEADEQQHEPGASDTNRRKSSLPQSFAVAQMHWTGERDKNAGHRKGHAILNPLNRRLMIQKRHDQRERDKQAFYLSMDVKRAIEAATNNYERWWLLQTHLAPPIAAEKVAAYNTLPCFGNSRIDANLSSLGSQPRRRSLSDHMKKIKSQRRPLAVENLKAVDIWQCGCDVCSGALMDYLRVHPSFLRNEDGFYAAFLEGAYDFEATVDEQDNEDTAELRKEKRVRTRAAAASKAEEIRKRRAKVTAPAGRKGRKGKKKRKKKKDKIDPKIWWQTVSTYTTPMWRPLIEPSQDSIDERQPPHKRRGSLQNKLNRSYSFDKLPRRKVKDNVGKLQESGSKDPIPERRQSIVDDNCPDERESSEEEDELDIEPLIAHNIIYVHKPSKRKSYTKLKLPSLPGIANPVRKQSRDNLTACGSAESNMIEYTPTISEATESEKSLRELENCNSKRSLDCNTAHVNVHFMHHVPDNFTELCLAGLAEYIVRFEAVTTRDKRYRRLESLTINRTPLCCYKTRSA